MDPRAIHVVRPEVLSMKNSNDTIGNRTRDLSVCSAVPQPTAPPPDPLEVRRQYKWHNVFYQFPYNKRMSLAPSAFSSSFCSARVERFTDTLKDTTMYTEQQIGTSVVWLT
jgi:hypothetical protein